MTTGVMEYGQAGSYNAPDDRRALTALAAGHASGVVNPVVLTAGSGLNVNVAAGWLAVADMGDGTLGVAGSASAMVVPGAAGDAGAPRTDSLWCDCSPVNGTWSVVIIPQSAEPGRIGIRLATITVPTAAGVSSSFTLTPRVASFANFPNLLNLGTSPLWTITPESPAGYLKMQGAGGVPIYVEAATGRIVPATPGSPNTPETWHAMSLINGWALTSASIAHYRKTAENELEIAMYLNYGGSVTNINICSIPAGWRPAVTHYLPVQTSAGGVSGSSSYVGISSGGTIYSGGFSQTTVGSLSVIGRIPLGSVP